MSDTNMSPAQIAAIYHESDSIPSHVGDFLKNIVESFNPDGATRTEMDKLAGKIKSGMRGLGEPEYGYARQLFDYLSTKQSAMRDREAGRINRAMALENKCDSIYNAMPFWMRW